MVDGAPTIYTDREDGVPFQTDIRSDRFEIALDASEKITANKLAKREERANLRVVKDEAETGKTGDEAAPGAAETPAK